MNAHKRFAVCVPAFIVFSVLVAETHGDFLDATKLERDLGKFSRGIGSPFQYQACTQPGMCFNGTLPSGGTGDPDTISVGGLNPGTAYDLMMKRTLQKRGKQDSSIREFSSAEKKVIVDMHNQLRQSVNPPAANMQTMSWSDELERVAVNYASKCVFEHNPNRNREAPSFSSVGENLYAHSNSYDERQAIQSWYDEVKDYNYNANSCSRVCGHYTQVVWAKSNKVGCAVKFCNPMRSVSFGSGYIVVCNYAPAGNYIGQWPYEKGQGSTTLEKPDSSSGTSSPPDNNNGNTPSSTSSNNQSNTKKPKTRKKRPRNRNRNRSRKRNRNRNRSRSRKPKTNAPEWSKQMSGICNRVRSCNKKLASANKPVMFDWKNSQASSPSPSSSQPSWKQQLSRTCSRMRDRNSQLMSDMKSLTNSNCENPTSPTSASTKPADLNQKLSNICNNVRSCTSRLRRSCGRFRIRWTK